MQAEVEAANAAIAPGNELSESELLDILYHPLRRIARSLLRKEWSDTSLEATELVHQTILSKLMGKAVHSSSPDHYLGIAIHGMKQIMVDRGRRRAIRQRGQPDSCAKPSRGFPELAVMIRREIKNFEKTDPRAARIVEFRILFHHTWDEIALLENISARTVREDYTFAIAWLRSRFET